MKRVTLLAMIAVFACLPAASAKAPVNTRVTIDAAFYATGGTQFAGDIFSSRRSCKNGRLVKLFRIRPGADQKIATTRSQRGISSPGYFWGIAEPGAAPEGLYYVKVYATPGCRADRSGNERLAGF